MRALLSGKEFTRLINRPRSFIIKITGFIKTTFVSHKNSGVFKAIIFTAINLEN